MTAEIENRISPAVQQSQQESENGNHRLSEEEFIEQFIGTWEANWRTEIDNAERERRLEVLWGRIPEETASKLTTPGPDGQTLIRKTMAEFRERQRIKELKVEQRVKSKMGEGRRPPKGQRIHVRREKAEGRKAS